MNQRPIQQKRPWWLSGQALVEFSLILPTLLFLLLGIIDYGRILLVYSNSASAIRDASRNATLLGQDNSTNLPFYVSCATIIDQGNDILFATLNEINILYYVAADKSDTTELAAIQTRLENALTNPEQADFDCDGSANPLVSDGDVSTGDIMVVTLDVEIEFITPLLANIFPTLQLDFRSQRTIVTRLALIPSGPDRDGDGLLDGWELYWFGCLLEDYSTEPAKATDDPLIAITSGAPLRNRDITLPPHLVWIESGMPIASSWVIGTALNATHLGSYDDPDTVPNEQNINTSADFFDDCATEELDPDDFVDADFYPDGTNPLESYNVGSMPFGCKVATVDGETVWQECIVPNTFQYNATDDPDGDTCNNGCEEVRDLNPLEYDTGAVDSDGDGLSDGQEVAGYNLSTRSVYNASCVAIAVGSETFLDLDPTDPDTDQDGLSDGAEVLGALTFNALPIYTDPEDPDTDDDGILDGDELDITVNSAYRTNPTNNDTDCDGILDNLEISGFVLENLFIDGVNVKRTVQTDPTNPDGDGDGFTDGDERDGLVVGTGTYCNPTGCVLDPSTRDTDGDGLWDDEELGSYDTNPTKTDTDGDGLKDGDEVALYDTDPAVVNSDIADENCTAANGTPNHTINDKLESVGPLVVTAGGDLDPDSDGLKNGVDDDSDGDDAFSWVVSDPLTDCNEIYLYGINPYMQDTDGDTTPDGRELELFCRDPKVSDFANGESCNSSSSDGDDLPDLWEQAKFGDHLTQDNSGNIDNDNCDNLCEYNLRTEPLNPDTDGDLLKDGDETSYGTNPRNPDTDGDGLTDGAEVNGITNSGTNFVTTINGVVFTYTGGAKPSPVDPDTDSDGLWDDDEIANKTRYDLADTDGDGLSDLQEVNGIPFSSVINDVPVNVNIVSSPLERDGDFDGLSDYNEIFSITYKTDPLDPDTDGDGIQDGTTSGVIGEKDNDFDATLKGWGTNPRDNDTDTDGVDDYTELVGIDDYSMEVDGATVVVDLAGYMTSINPKFAIFNSDTDGDELSDGDELVEGTNPLDPDTDDDFILDGDDPFPLVPDAAADTDLDGIPDVDELVPPIGSDRDVTDELDFDTDNDGLGDGDEYITGFTSSAVGYSGGSTTTINYTAENFQLRTGAANGYDSDGDGLSDAFELYWYVLPNNIRIDHPQFRTNGSGGFTGTMEACGFNLASVGNKPLHPDVNDTDDDGIFDGAECNIYGTNPFSAAVQGPMLAQVTNPSFLAAVVEPAINGNYQLAAAGARALNYTLSTDGRLTVYVLRDLSGGDAILLQNASVQGCGASGYTNASNVYIPVPNVCGVFTGGGGNQQNKNTVTAIAVRVPLSRLYYLLQDAAINTISPTP